jgi:hypothetical protein
VPKKKDKRGWKKLKEHFYSVKLRRIDSMAKSEYLFKKE